MVESRSIGKGTGIFIPEDIWAQALPYIERHWGREPRRPPRTSGVVLIRLRSGARIGCVGVRVDGEILFRGTGLRGPEVTTEGLDFTSEDIEAIRVVIGRYFGFGERKRWFKRTAQEGG
jgi:hypothetical protein